MTAAVLTLALVLGSFLVVFLFLFPLGRGAVYAASTPEKVSLMAEMSAAAPGERAADLGSGDGRIVIALARRGAEAHGYEINPVLVLLSRRAIRRHGLEGRAVVHWRSFWRADLSRFDVLTLFQGSFIMRRLEGKVRREMPPGARIISDFWAFPSLAPERRIGTVYRYRLGPRR
ncbi:MAG TPA: hypothetical protein VFI08_01640 [Spirochaetia bacterium]|nr:hypothetical protein [Spirochaetia bacterium]